MRMMTKAQDATKKSPAEEVRPRTGDETQVAHVAEILRDIEVGMLTTVSENGRLGSRPMVLLDRTFDGRLAFLTDQRTGKVDDIEARPDVNASFADPKGSRYLSLSGRAKVRSFEGDGAARAFEEFGRWLADDVTAEDVAILEIEVERGEYWDESKSLMRRLGEAVGGMIRGSSTETPRAAQHGTVELSRSRV